MASTGQVRLDRVVAVVAHLPGRRRWGSGYLVTPTTVMTAWHCVVADTETCAAVPLEVRRQVDGAWQSAYVRTGLVSRSPTADQNGSWGLDVALLTLGDPPWAHENWDAPSFARVRREESGELRECVVVGYPTYELSPDEELTTAEIRGFIRQGDGHGSTSEHLVLRDSTLGDVRRHPALRAARPERSQTDPHHDHDSDVVSDWGGLSGALVFHGGRVIGHVVEHHPHRGHNPLAIVPVERLACAAQDTNAARIAQALGLGRGEDLPWATGADRDLAGMVELLGPDGDLPQVDELTPYQLGADQTAFSIRDTTRGEPVADPYLPRTANAVDQRLAATLQQTPRSLVLLVGPSKSGKTRTAYEGVRAQWPHARLIKPDPAHLLAILEHPRVRSSSWPLVLWLDDLQRFLRGEQPLTPGTLAALLRRPGPTVVVATLRQEERKHLATDSDLTRGARQLLDDAARTTVDLAPTSADAAEQQAARAAYPDLDLHRYGLAEQLAGAPALLRAYQDADPVLRSVLQVAIDWERGGMARPIPSEHLVELARRRVVDLAPHLDAPQEDVRAAVQRARAPVHDIGGRTSGQVTALTTHRSEDGSVSYEPYPYLVAHDNGQDSVVRPIDDWFWRALLERLDDPGADAIGHAAYALGNHDVSLEAFLKAARTGDPRSMTNVGVLLSWQDPPDLLGARQWWERSAEAGHTDAMFNLGHAFEGGLDDAVAARAWHERAANLGHARSMHSLANMLCRHPGSEDLTAARRWYEAAVAAGHPLAMTSFGLFLEHHTDPIDIHGARYWFERAAEAGQPDALVHLGDLLSDKQQPPDLGGARASYERGAATGHAGAMNSLANLLSDRLDPPDLDEARRWYERAIDAGSQAAVFNLGVLLAEQLDPPDLDGARRRYEQAAASGHAGAMNSLANLLSDRLDPPELDQARRWYERAIEAGNDAAMLNLGLLLAEQLDPPRLDEARRWYEQAAEQGDPGAMNSLANLLCDRLDPPDLDGARQWYERALDAGHDAAAFNLGFFLAEQLDPPRLDEARRRYEQAAEAGNDRAMCNLGVLLATRVDPPDVDQARRWYERAAAAGNDQAMTNLAALLSSQQQPPDFETARSWGERAAALGNPGAAVLVGDICASEDPERTEEAAHWYRRAMDTGDATGALRLGAMSAAHQDWDTAVDRWREAAQSAQHGVSEHAWNGLAVVALARGEDDQARDLLACAADAGLPYAHSFLDILGDVAQRRRAAVETLCELPDSDSGALLFRGIAAHWDGDVAAARELWQKAVDNGDVIAPLLLEKLGDA